MIKNPLESPLASLEALSPTALLERLRKAAADTVDDTTREKFERLIQKLEKALEKGQSWTTTDAKNSLADLKITVSDITGKLTSEEKKLITGNESPKTIPTSPKAAGEMKDVANKWLEAIKTGNIKWAKDAAVSVAESVGVDSKKILAGGGIASVWAAISEVIGNIGTTISGFFEKIMIFLKTLFWGIFGGGVAAAAGKAVDMGKEAVKEVKDKVSPPETIKLSEDQKLALRESAVAQTKKNIEEKYWHGTELSSERAKSLITILQKYKFPEEAVTEKGDKWLKEGKLSVGDALDIFEKMTIGNSMVIFELLLAGVIPAWGFGVSMAKGSLAAPKQHFVLTLDTLGISTAPFGFDELGLLAESVKNDPQKKASLLYLLYKPASIFASISGTMVAETLSLGVGLMTNTTVDGIKMSMDVMRWHLSGNYGPLIENFSQLEAKLWIAANSSSHAAALKWLQQEMRGIQNNYRLIQALEVEMKVPGTLKGLADLDTLLPAKIAREIRTTTDISQMRTLIASNLQTSVRPDWLVSIAQDAQKFWGSGAARILEQGDKLKGILDIQKELITRSPLGMKYIDGFTDIAKIATISRVQDTTVLMIKNTESLAQLGTTFTQLWTAGMKHLFNGIPLIGLWVGTIELLSNEKKTEISDWVKNIGAALSMPVAWVMLLSEVSISKTDGLTFENTAKGTLGVTILGGSAYYMIRNPKQIVPFITGYSTLKTAAQTLWAWVRWYRIVSAVAPKLWAEIWAILARWGLTPQKAAGTAVAAAIALWVYMNYSMTDPHKTLTDKGLIDGETGKLTPQFGKLYSTLSPQKQKEILDAVISTKLPRQIVDKIQTSYELGAYTVELPSKEYARQTQIAINHLVDELASSSVWLVNVVVNVAES